MTQEVKKLTQKEKLLKKLAVIEQKEKDAARKAKGEYQRKQRVDRLRSARIVGEFFLDGGFVDLGALLNNRGERLDSVLKNESDRAHLGFKPLEPATVKIQ